MSAEGDGLGIQRLQQREVIGRGGQAVVYRATDPLLQRDVAIKVFLGERDSERLERELTRELRALGQLTGHPNIVTVFQTGVTDHGRPYVEMEYVAGGSLAAYLDRRGRMPEGDVVRLGAQLASALAAAHRLGVIHRDVKPMNVLLTADGNSKLADFGIATIGAGATTTGSDRLRYTIAYAAPEVLLGASASPASDVYSLALTMMTALSGSSPFQETGESLQGMVGRIIANRVPDPRRYGASEQLASILEQATRGEPAERPTADGLQRALVALDRQPIVTPPPPSPMGTTRDTVAPLPPPVTLGTTEVPPEPTGVIGGPVPPPRVPPPPLKEPVAPTVVPAAPLESPEITPTTQPNLARRVVVAAVAAVVLLGSVGVAFAAMSADGGGGTADEITSTSDAQATTSTATTTGVTTTVAPTTTVRPTTSLAPRTTASTISANKQATLPPTTAKPTTTAAPTTTTAPCVNVPNVVGTSRFSARSTLEGKGFKVSSIGGWGGGSFDRVYKMSPSGGSCRAKGSTVKIYWNDPDKQP